MTPDREHCRGVSSRRAPYDTQRNWTLYPGASRPGDEPVRLEGGVQLQKYLLIATGGALGSVARYWVGSTIGSRMGSRFPYGTFIVNLTACIIIGFSLTYLGKRLELNPTWRYLAAVGFIGAYSTFSTFEWETLSTIRSGAFVLAALYSVGSLILGLAATWLGTTLADAIP